MTYKQKYYSCKTWHSKVLVMNLYFRLMNHIKGYFSVRAVAKYFGVSVGLTSENLKLAEKMDYKLRNFKTRKDALYFIRKE